MTSNQVNGIFVAHANREAVDKIIELHRKETSTAI
jgi:hypothetical protein